MWTDSPVAQLVAKSLKDHRLVGRKGPGGCLLLGKIGDKVVGSEVIETRLSKSRLRKLGTQRTDLADEPAVRPSQL